MFDCGLIILGGAVRVTSVGGQQDVLPVIHSERRLHGRVHGHAMCPETGWLHKMRC